MSGLFTRFFARPTPVYAEAGIADAAAFAALHASAFRRGWSEDEFQRLLLDRQVLAHRAMVRDALVGFVLSRSVVGEAEILSVAVAAPERGRGVARQLLTLHLRRLAGLGVASVFLEVDEANAPARRLYARLGFREIGRRKGYYPQTSGAPGTALVLSRELA